MTPPPRIFHLVQKAHSALFRAADKALRRDLDITVSQQGVLFVLGQRDGQPIGAIAAALAMGKSSLTGLVDRMADKRLVRREFSEDDGRSQLVWLEPDGRDLVARSVSRTKTANARLLEPFSADEQAVIARFLIHVADNAERLMAAPAPEIQGAHHD